MSDEGFTIDEDRLTVLKVRMRIAGAWQTTLKQWEHCARLSPIDPIWKSLDEMEEAAESFECAAPARQSFTKE
jgi:hypothetical protein